MHNFDKPIFYILLKDTSTEEFNYVEMQGFYEAIIKNWEIFQFGKHFTLDNKFFPIFYSKN